MTLSNTNTQVTVSGDGLTTTFSYAFYMVAATNAQLIYTDTSGTTSSIATASFSVSGVTNTAGGTFTYPLVGSPIVTGSSLTLKRVLPLTQNAAIGDQGNFYPVTVENALDQLTMMVQQLQQEIVNLQVAVAADNP